jgi:hypothetical protein
MHNHDRDRHNVKQLRRLQLEELEVLLLLDALKGTTFMDVAAPSAIQSKIVDAIRRNDAMDEWFDDPDDARSLCSGPVPGHRRNTWPSSSPLSA